MTVERRVTKQAMVVMAASFALGLMACSSDDSTPAKTTDGGSTSAALSASFGSQCSRCHGSTGLGAGKYPRLPGKPDADTFVAFVRAGKNEMPAFTTAQISDADLRSDFAVLAGK